MNRATQYIASVRDGQRASFEPSPGLFTQTDLHVGGVHDGARILAIGTLEVVQKAMLEYNARLDPALFTRTLERDGTAPVPEQDPSSGSNAGTVRGGAPGSAPSVPDTGR